MRIHILRGVSFLRRAAAALLHLMRRFGSALVEMDRQQRRLTTIHRSTDAYLSRPDVAPETYREFLSRTRGPLLHEPSARARLAGRGVQ
jgi:hypothetical protein